MTTINTMQDLLQLLRDQPQWAEELRGILLSRELQDLPAAVRELTKVLRESTERTDQRLATLETDTAQLKADTAQLKADTAQLKADTAQLKADTAQLKADTAQLKADMTQVKGDMGRLRGAEYERRAEDRAVHRTLTELGFIQPRIIKGPRSGLQPLLSSVLARARNRAAREQRTLPQPGENANFLNADIIIADLGDPDEGDHHGPPAAYALFEASITADSGDVARARVRAQTLAETLNVQVIPAVLADNAPEQVATEADTAGVRLFIAPEH